MGSEFSLFDAIIESIPAGICVFDSEGRILFANPQFAKMHGAPDHLFLEDKTLKDYLRIASERGDFVGDPDELFELLLDAMAQGQTIQATHTYGDGRVVRIVDTPLHGGGWVSFHLDLTNILGDHLPVSSVAA